LEQHDGVEERPGFAAELDHALLDELSGLDH
jgi:hypothetical protein